MHTVDSALQDELISLVERLDDKGSYRIRLGTLSTIVTINLRQNWGTRTSFKQSHAIKTPTQATPFWSCVNEGVTPGDALRRAIEGLTTGYRKALREGHTPAEDWLVPAGK